MKIYVDINKGRECLPEIIDLVDVMWEKGISLSRAGDGTSFKNCTSLALCWDKWVDDKRWEMHPKFKEYIYFEVSPEDKLVVTIEVDDESTIVDKRSVHKAALYIAERCDGKLSIDGITWIVPSTYREITKVYLQYDFKESIEKSLVTID